MRTIAALVLFACIAVPLHGDTPVEPSKPGSDVGNMNLEDLLKMEVTAASKISQLISDAPGAVEVIPDYQITGYGWHSLNDILYAQPGFSPSQDYDRRTVSSRGLFEGWNNNHLLLMIDGVPYNDNLYGTAYTWEITPLVFSKRVEVLRGPGSSLYGSNATNGAINIRTISASDVEGGIGEVRYGAEGTLQADYLTATKNDLFSAVGSFTLFRTKGFEYPSYDASRRTDASGALAQFATHDARSNHYFFGKLDGEGALKGLSLQLHWQEWQFETGHGWIFYIPDFAEAMHENRELATLSYRRQSSSGIQQEYVARYQRHNIDWNQRYYPNGATDPYGDYYPAGLWELLQTHADDLFTRAQVTMPLPKAANLITGVEVTNFRYNGDHEHASNVNINNGDDFSPIPGGAFKELRPWLEWIDHEPVWNTALYAQAGSGVLFGSRLTATLGLRYDRESFKFHALDVDGRPTESKSFSHVSPRLALVGHATDRLTLKFLGGSAFRAPAPTELFGANTYSLASNLRQLKPEEVTTLEAAAEYRVSRDVLVRANAFDTNAKNQIAYSVANANLSTNIYSLKTRGAEGEVLIGFHAVSGFANLSWAQRRGETILDNTISLSPHTLTWAPSTVANAGMLYDNGRAGGSVTAHYQGQVRRRSSDSADPQFLPYRPEDVKSWFDVGARAFFRPRPRVELYAEAKNLLNERSEMLIKNNAFPFDYSREPRRVFAGARLTF